MSFLPWKLIRFLSLEGLIIESFFSWNNIIWKPKARAPTYLGKKKNVGFGPPSLLAQSWVSIGVFSVFLTDLYPIDIPLCLFQLGRFATQILCTASLDSIDPLIHSFIHRPTLEITDWPISRLVHERINPFLRAEPAWPHHLLKVSFGFIS